MIVRYSCVRIKARNVSWLACSYLQAKGDYRSEDLNTTANTILDILLQCEHNSAAQVCFSNFLPSTLVFSFAPWYSQLHPRPCYAVHIKLCMLQARWASAAAQLLRTWRHQINIIVPWRPLYNVLHASLRSSNASYEGKPAWYLPHRTCLTCLQICCMLSQLL